MKTCLGLVCLWLSFIGNSGKDAHMRTNVRGDDNDPMKNSQPWMGKGESNIGLPLDCFSACGKYSNHSGQIGLFTKGNKSCHSWGNYSNKTMAKMIGINTTFCVYGRSDAWCATEPYNDHNKAYNWDYCKKEVCRSVNKAKHCRKQLKVVSTSSSIQFESSYLSNDSDRVLVLLYTDTNQCYLTNAGPHHSSELDSYVNSFFQFCIHLNSHKGQSSTITLSPLPASTNYRIYVLPVLNSTTIGIVTRMNVSTKPSIKLTPDHIRLISKNASSVKIRIHQLSLYKASYTITLQCIDAHTKHFVNITNETVHGLDPCRKYCFNLTLESIDTFETESVTKCYNTTAEITDVIISQRTDKTIQWSYNNEYNCPIMFDGFYWPTSFNDTHNAKSQFTTRYHRVIVPSLAFGMNYRVRVRARLTVDDNYIIYGNYSESIQRVVSKQDTNTITRLNTRTKKTGESIPLLSWSVALPIAVVFFLIGLVKRKAIVALFTNNTTGSTAFIKSTSQKKSDLTVVQMAHLFDNEKFLNIKTNIGEFVAYYKSISQKKSTLLENEFKELSLRTKHLQDSESISSCIGKMSHNAEKNRFSNILPYDHTRVLLKNRSLNDNYINASYVPFENDSDRIEYIASQGPINTSVSDFWKMIWDEDVTCILMLTECYEKEKFKCVQYWPEVVNIPLIYGNDNEMNITLINEDTKQNYVERKFEIGKKNTEVMRSITHLHMIAWSDFSAPDLQTFEGFLFRFHELCNDKVKTPYLIHCSAGVGRTGTFITIDRIIKKLVDGLQYVNIYKEVFELRKCRNFMVQRVAQYIFIYDFINYFVEKYIRQGKIQEITEYYNE